MQKIYRKLVPNIGNLQLFSENARINKTIVLNSASYNHEFGLCGIYFKEAAKRCADAMTQISNMLIPALIFYIIAMGLAQKKDIYASFTKGAKDGMKTVAGIVPTLIGLMIAVGVLRASGFLEFLGGALGRIAGRFVAGFPNELISLFIIKLFSSSAATGLALDIFKQYGTDSFAGFATSLALASTETVFYTMSVYFMAARVTKTRWTLAGALLSTGAGLVASVIIAALMAA